ncbi:MAG: sulfite oxidase [Nitrospirota bacterium]|nr:sulfite oxidase [Nitrospirota bacterium]MDP3598310.1 sulfite oxidase [Nitrospirota bacterium]
MTISRRSLLGRLLQGLGAAVIVSRHVPVVLAAREELARNESGPLTVHVTRPFDAETPVREFRPFLTPNHRFFVRSHFGPPPPDAITEANWTLRIGGLVERSQSFTLKDLRQLDAVTITAVVQCSGNGRAFHRPKVPGVQWERGAVGNAEWTGVRLRDLLAKAGVQACAHHVQFQGADRPVVAAVPLFTRSIPLEKAIHPDTILAYEMNGRPLPLLHGAPLRVITPGWMADSCIKWLTEITVRQDEAQGYYMQTAYRYPTRPVVPGEAIAASDLKPVEEMVVKSLIAAPQEGESVKSGPVTIQGMAWSGEAKVVKVDLSFDEGKTWESARLVGEDRPYAWRQWQLVWKAKTAGTFTILCRATDAHGEQQPATTPWSPSGFLWNGWDRVTVTVSA